MAKTNIVSDEWEFSLARNEIKQMIYYHKISLVKLALETGHF